MNILILGQGGREHAMAKHLAADSEVRAVYVTPGNPGMQQNKITPLFIDPVKIAELLKTIKEKQIDYVVIGPEKYIDEGLTNKLLAAGIQVVGPNHKAGLLESSKVYSKNFMTKYRLPTAEYQVFQNSQEAIDFVKSKPWEDGFVIKIDGLAAGKGVYVYDSYTDLTYQNRIKDIVAQHKIVLIEKRLIGKEVSVFYAVLNNKLLKIGEACDYKRINDHDKGPNTGGMGSYSPAHWLSELDRQELIDIENKITVGLTQQKIKYNGFLFVGLLKAKLGLNLLEFNVRLGDPETQVILPALKTSFHQICLAIAEKSPQKFQDLQSKIQYSSQSFVHVVVASRGYPASEMLLRQVIEINDETVKNDLLYSGVSQNEHRQLINSGGRVCGLTRGSDNLTSASNKVYADLKHLSFKGMHFRRDIGK